MSKPFWGQHGIDLDNVAKCTVILDTMQDFRAFNEVYSQYFVEPPLPPKVGHECQNRDGGHCGALNVGFLLGRPIFALWFQKRSRI